MTLLAVCCGGYFACLKQAKQHYSNTQLSQLWQRHIQPESESVTAETSRLLSRACEVVIALLKLLYLNCLAKQAIIISMICYLLIFLTVNNGFLQKIYPDQ